MTQTNSYLLLCGLCCIYPIVIATVAVIAYRRFQMGGWRAIFFGERKEP